MMAGFPLANWRSGSVPTLIVRMNLISSFPKRSRDYALVTYKGLPAPIICDYLSREESRKHYAEGTEFQIGKIEMVANTGTYLDCPFHRYERGKDLLEVGVERLADLDGIVIRADHKETVAMNADFFRGKELRGRAVLVHTGWDAYWKTDQYFEHLYWLLRISVRKIGNLKESIWYFV